MVAWLVLPYGKLSEDSVLVRNRAHDAAVRGPGRELYSVDFEVGVSEPGVSQHPDFYDAELLLAPPDDDRCRVPR